MPESTVNGPQEEVPSTGVPENGRNTDHRSTNEAVVEDNVQHRSSPPRMNHIPRSTGQKNEPTMEEVHHFANRSGVHHLALWGATSTTHGLRNVQNRRMIP